MSPFRQCIGMRWPRVFKPPCISRPTDPVARQSGQNHKQSVDIDFKFVYTRNLRESQHRFWSPLLPVDCTIRFCPGTRHRQRLRYTLYYTAMRRSRSIIKSSYEVEYHKSILFVTEGLAFAGSSCSHGECLHVGKYPLKKMYQCEKSCAGRAEAGPFRIQDPRIRLSADRQPHSESSVQRRRWRYSLAARELTSMLLNSCLEMRLLVRV